jgi:hypothetical protein
MMAMEVVNLEPHRIIATPRKNGPVDEQIIENAGLDD